MEAIGTMVAKAHSRKHKMAECTYCYIHMASVSETPSNASCENNEYLLGETNALSLAPQYGGQVACDQESQMHLSNLRKALAYAYPVIAYPAIVITPTLSFSFSLSLCYL